MDGDVLTLVLQRASPNARNATIKIESERFMVQRTVSVGTAEAVHFCFGFNQSNSPTDDGAVAGVAILAARRAAGSELVAWQQQRSDAERAGYEPFAIQQDIMPVSCMLNASAGFSYGCSLSGVKVKKFPAVKLATALGLHNASAGITRWAFKLVQQDPGVTILLGIGASHRGAIAGSAVGVRCSDARPRAGKLTPDTKSATLEPVLSFGQLTGGTHMV